MATRPAGKAGSWYERRPDVLEAQLQKYLDDVPSEINGHELPIAGARIVIAPHAGYDYSGPCAAWAYKLLDLSKAKRVFVLGPSHTYALSGCAATSFGQYATPLGDLVVDRDTLQRVKEAAGMDDIPSASDMSEHSLEMHLPYLYLRCRQTFGSATDKFPQIVPLLIGSNRRAEEKAVGRALASYVKDPENAFIVSSDFCHWGPRNFGYSPYSPTADITQLKHLRQWDATPDGLPIYETIQRMDEAAMEAVESGSHDAFLDNLKLTQNTVCGRHPIGAMMAALEVLHKEPDYEEGKARFHVVRYERSNDVKRPADFSVSYVSAYAIL